MSSFMSHTWVMIGKVSKFRKHIMSHMYKEKSHELKGFFTFVHFSIKIHIVYCSGVLLLNITVYIIGADWRVGEVCNDGDRCNHGWDDLGLSPLDGSHRKTYAAPLRPGRNVHLLHFHHDFFPHKGVSYKISTNCYFLIILPTEKSHWSYLFASSESVSSDSF